MLNDILEHLTITHLQSAIPVEEGISRSAITSRTLIATIEKNAGDFQFDDRMIRDIKSNLKADGMLNLEYKMNIKAYATFTNKIKSNSRHFEDEYSDIEHDYDLNAVLAIEAVDDEYYVSLSLTHNRVEVYDVVLTDDQFDFDISIFEDFEFDLSEAEYEVVSWKCTSK